MTNPNACAYPFVHPFDHTVYLGLTKREYFAAMAMQGMLAGGVDWSSETSHLDYIAKASYRYADALIKELNKAE